MPSFLTYLVKKHAYSWFLRDKIGASVQIQLRLLQAAFRSLPNPQQPEDTACNVFTYHGEDGLLLHLVTQLPAIPRTFLDIGSGDCVKSNCALWAVHFGWAGLFIDADRRNIAIGRSFYSRLPFTKFAPPRFICTRVTPENVGALTAGLQDLGLLSIDIDGDDYWIWKSLPLRPWIVIIEARIEFGAVSVVSRYGAAGGRVGASVSALCTLAEELGYVLAAYNRHGYNLVFVRKDLVGPRIKALDPAALLSDPAIAACFEGQAATEGKNYFFPAPGS
jgi:hypothetical protein